MTSMARAWRALAVLFFVLGILPAGPLWLVWQLGRLCFALANLFMGPYTICRGISRGDLDFNGNPRRHRPKWRIVRAEKGGRQ
jgi:hypothetical protein